MHPVYVKEYVILSYERFSAENISAFECLFRYFPTEVAL